MEMWLGLHDESVLRQESRTRTDWGGCRARGKSFWWSSLLWLSVRLFPSCSLYLSICLKCELYVYEIYFLRTRCCVSVCVCICACVCACVCLCSFLYAGAPCAMVHNLQPDIYVCMCILVHKCKFCLQKPLRALTEDCRPKAKAESA